MGLGIGSIICGVVGLLICIFTLGFWGWIGGVIAIAGIVLGAMGRKNIAYRGLATTGLIISICATIVSFSMYLACAACVGVVKFVTSLF